MTHGICAMPNIGSSFFPAYGWRWVRLARNVADVAAAIKIAAVGAEGGALRQRADICLADAATFSPSIFSMSAFGGATLSFVS
jgi:hypothetical protein